MAAANKDARDDTLGRNLAHQYGLKQAIREGLRAGISAKTTQGE
jgi:hypothetical protein